jgi:N-acetylmuramoyl-L-alanine amidase
MVEKKVKYIYVHCSDSEAGDALAIDRWHKDRGWRGIGYHFVILNGRPFEQGSYWQSLDGQIHSGTYLNTDAIYTPNEVGIHVAGENGVSLGVCLIGRTKFTDAQLLAAKHLLAELQLHFTVPTANIKGHYEGPGVAKTCPNIPMDSFREFLDGTKTMLDLQADIAIKIKEIYGDKSNG